MKTEDITINVNLDEVKRILGECISADSVLLPAAAVRALYGELPQLENPEQVYDLLIGYGGIRGTKAAE